MSGRPPPRGPRRSGRLPGGGHPLRAYLYARYSADTRDEAALAKLSELEILFLDFQRLRPRLTRYLALKDPEEAGPHRLLVEEAKEEALHMMPEGEEVLAAELSLSGRAAWDKLHESLTSQITAVVDGEEMPITKVRNLYFHPEEEVRKKAYEAELKAWEAHEVPLAFALNGVKGEASVLNRRRGYRDDLEPTLHENRITRKALKAMQEAVGESLPLFRRYFLLKARALGKERLDWWDLFAPWAGEGAGAWRRPGPSSRPSSPPWCRTPPRWRRWPSTSAGWTSSPERARWAGPTAWPGAGEEPHPRQLRGEL